MIGETNTEKEEERQKKTEKGQNKEKDLKFCTLNINLICSYSIHLCNSNKMYRKTRTKKALQDRDNLDSNFVRAIRYVLCLPFTCPFLPFVLTDDTMHLLYNKSDYLRITLCMCGPYHHTS